MTAEELVKAGQLPEALKALEQRVRGNPADAKLRVFLFQLLAVMGNYERALTQLNVSADLSAENLPMAQVCRQTLLCEALRADIFAGERMPLVLGEPQEWLGWLIQANQLSAKGHTEEGQALREKAFEAAPVTAGTINEQRFEWIADADQRLGPVLEVVVDGKYYWCPFANIQEISVAAPADLRDLVWLPAQFTWINGGKAFGLIPTRYTGTEKSGDGQLMLARKTEWLEGPGGVSVGVGQRLLATDAAEIPLLEVRKIALEHAAQADAIVGG